jgi:hypothetical protein
MSLDLDFSHYESLKTFDIPFPNGVVNLGVNSAGFRENTTDKGNFIFFDIDTHVTDGESKGKNVTWNLCVSGPIQKDSDRQRFERNFADVCIFLKMCVGDEAWNALAAKYGLGKTPAHAALACPGAVISANVNKKGQYTNVYPQCLVGTGYTPVVPDRPTEPLTIGAAAPTVPDDDISGI